MDIMHLSGVWVCPFLFNLIPGCTHARRTEMSDSSEFSGLNIFFGPRVLVWRGCDNANNKSFLVRKQTNRVVVSGPVPVSCPPAHLKGRLWIAPVSSLAPNPRLTKESTSHKLFQENQTEITRAHCQCSALRHHLEIRCFGNRIYVY